MIKTGYLKKRQRISMIFNSETFRNYFISSSAYSLIMWLMRSPKNYEKIANLKIWYDAFSCMEKKWFSQILQSNIYFSH